MESNKKAVWWNSREYLTGIIGFSLFYLPFYLGSYPSSLGRVEMIVCILAAIIASVFMCVAMLLLNRLEDTSESYMGVASCIGTGLFCASLMAVPAWIGPNILYPPLDKIVRGSFMLEPGSLISMLATILGIISSIITIYEFLKRKRGSAS